MKFKPLKPSDYPQLKKFFRQQKYKLCAYSLPSIIVWSNDSYQPYGAVADESLFVCAEFSHQPENRHLILPVSPSKVYHPETLQDIALDLGFDAYCFVSEEYIQEYGKNVLNAFFDIEEETEFEDYIYLTEDLAKLKGNKYSKKRNLINQFRRHYVDRNRVRIEPITSADVDECIVFLEKWCQEHDCDSNPDETLACEKQAAINTLENMEILEVRGLLLRLDGIVSAFGIASHLTDRMGVLHFEKAFADIKGLYQYFDNQCAKRLFKGYTYINKESDMNLPGLAKAKKSYHPTMMVKSYKMKVR